MNIVHLSKFYPPYRGGLEKVVYDLATSQASQGHAVQVVCSDECRSLIDANKGVTVYRSREQKRIAATSLSVRYMVNTFRLINRAVVHIHLPNPMSVFSLLIALLLGRRPAKIVVHWHSDVIKQRFSLLLYHPLCALILCMADHIIVTSYNYLSKSKQLLGFKKKCTVVPIGIAPGEWGMSIGESRFNEVLKDNRFIFSVGRHVYYKGFENLIRAFRFVNDERCILVIGGQGPDTNIYRGLIDELGLNNKVLIAGALDDSELQALYRQACIFCLPSCQRSEAFGVVQLEAMSHGTPVVSTDIVGSGVSWVNRHMESGLICKANDPDSLSHALNLLLSDDELRRRLGKQAKLRYEKNFTREVMVSSVTALYEGQ